MTGSRRLVAVLLVAVLALVPGAASEAEVARATAQVATPGGPPGLVPVADRPAGQAKQAADQVLAGPLYNPADHSNSWIERGLDELAELLQEILERIFGQNPDARIGDGQEGRSLGGSLRALLLVALFIAAVVVVRLGYGRYRGRTNADPDEDETPVDTDDADDVIRPADEWLRLAATAEAEGRLRDSLRCRWRALVADLATQGLVDEVPGRTAGEYRRQVAARSEAVSPAFASATTVFERAWYGGVARPADLADLDEQAARARAASTLVGSSR